MFLLPNNLSEEEFPLTMEILNLKISWTDIKVECVMILFQGNGSLKRPYQVLNYISTLILYKTCYQISQNAQNA